MNYFIYGKELLKILIDNGYAAYFVGGVVRDKLLSSKIHDIDIATSALPEQIVSIFDNVDNAGIQYNCVKVKYKGYDYEITAFREDITYLDHRHPMVEYTDKIEVDLARRDFTINALAMDMNEKVIDIFGGLTDLKNGIIKAVGIPLNRFNEDALRMLRAFYFVSKLGFDIDALTLDGIEENAHLIERLSSHRVMQELYKIVNHEHSVKAFKYISQTKVLNYLPGLKKGIIYLVENNIKIDNIILFYCLCFYLEGDILEYWHFSKVLKNKIKMIIDLALVTEDGNFNRLILYSNGLEICSYTNMLNYLLGKNGDLLEYIKKEYESLPIKKTCDLKFKGQDIMEMTNKDNFSWIGQIIDRIKYEILINNLENDYEKIKQFIIKNGLLEE